MLQYIHTLTLTTPLTTHTDTHVHTHAHTHTHTHTLVNKHTPSFICTSMHNRALSSPTYTGVDHALLLWRSIRVVQDNAMYCQPAYISPIWVPVILGWSSCHGTNIISSAVGSLVKIIANIAMNSQWHLYNSVMELHTKLSMNNKYCYNVHSLHANPVWLTLYVWAHIVLVCTCSMGFLITKWPLPIQHMG